MRILIRTSRWAVWARRLGSFALPLTVISVFLHRGRVIESTDFAVALGAAMSVGLLAVLFGLIALVRLWHTGDRGWGLALTGLMFGLVCVAPVAYGMGVGLQYPAMNDVTTSPDRPPVLVTIDPRRTVTAPRDLVLAAFPDVVTRSYPLDVASTFQLVEILAAERGWELRQRREPPNEFSEGQINALATTLFGWRDEVAVRVSANGDGSTVDMRSASRVGERDLGANANRIESFLVALDDAVTILIRDQVMPEAPEPFEEAG